MDNNFIPLSVPCLRGNELKYVKECIDTEWVSSAGTYVNRFEEGIAQYSGAKYAVACSSGTSALHICLVLSGVNEQDEVIVPSITFIAPVNTVRYVGARPVFMDCDDYLNINTDKLTEFCEQECYFTGGRLINKKTTSVIKALIPVHVFGSPVNIEPLMDLAEKYNLKIIEDATESLGSYYINGKYKNQKTGTIGDFGCYSFNGNKIITTGGGGMIVTNSPAYAQKAKYLTTQAKDDEVRFVHNQVGYNYRMNNLQAAIGCAQLEKISGYIDVKRKNFLIYKEGIADIEGLDLIGEPDYGFSNFWHYSLMVDKNKYGLSRDELMEKLSRNNIQARPLWQPNHLQAPYKDYQAYRIEKALYYHKNILSIPCSVSLTGQDIDKVIGVLRNA
ncbi:MAG: LegC family aminotransferase [Candidatus Omnitrophota bacterium]